jgi:hypothetical protein
MRKHVRFATSFEAEMIDQGESHPVIVGDISVGGALLRAETLPIVGRHIWIKAIGLNASAQVRWMQHGVCGIRFSEPLEPLQVLRDNWRDYCQDIRRK